MSLAGLAFGALALLGVGVAAVHYLPKIGDWFRKTFSDLKDELTAGFRSVTAAPGKALDYVYTSHDLALHPEQILEKDPITGQPLTGYIGGTGGKDLSQTVADNRAAAAAQRATEPKSATVARLQQEKALLQATGQPSIIDVDGGGQKLTLADINTQLASLGVT